LILWKENGLSFFVKTIRKIIFRQKTLPIWRNLMSTHNEIRTYDCSKVVGARPFGEWPVDEDRDAVELLKAEWLQDRSWDLANTQGFHRYRVELQQFMDNHTQ
jgi:hypothetical protein